MDNDTDATVQFSITTAEPGLVARLEVQRLPAHTDEPVATIARRLSFPDPTNFGKFCTRHIGTCPGTFRHIIRAGSGSVKARWRARPVLFEAHRQ